MLNKKKSADISEKATAKEGEKKIKFYKKKWFWVIIVLLIVFIVFSGNNNEKQAEDSGDSIVSEEQTTSVETQEEKSEEEQNKDFVKEYESDIVVAAKMSLDDYIANYKLSLAPQMWTLAKFDDKDAVIGITDITFENRKGKYIYVGTLNFDDSGKVVSATPHYLEVNGEVLGNDGYCDEVFDQIRALSGQ